MTTEPQKQEQGSKAAGPPVIAGPSVTLEWDSSAGKDAEIEFYADFKFRQEPPTQICVHVGDTAKIAAALLETAFRNQPQPKFVASVSRLGTNTTFVSASPKGEHLNFKLEERLAGATTKTHKLNDHNRQVTLNCGLKVTLHRPSHGP